MFVSIIVPAKNEEEHISSCLESLVSQDYPKQSYEIIVVDNCSSDNTRSIAMTFDVRLQEVEGRVGKVRNYGAQLANGSVLAFIDADCLAPKDWLRQLTSLLATSENSVFGGGIENPKNASWIERYWILEGSAGPQMPKELIGANICIKKSDFFTVNGFDERLSSGEDSALSLNLRKERFKIIIDPKLNVIHLGNAKTTLGFLKRQMWHSQSYLNDLKGSLKDPVFLIVTTFLFAFTISALSIATSEWIALPATFITLLIPSILTTKRLIRARLFRPGISTLLCCYFLDLIYLVGRSIGLIKGLLLRTRTD